MTIEHSKIRILVLVILMMMVCSFSAHAAVKGSFVYKLSDFTGTIPYSWSRVVADKERNEIYVLYQNTIRVFNESGMEIYRFGDDLDLGLIVDVAVDQNGDILLLAYKAIRGEINGEIIRCNYRGEPKSEIELKNLPPEFSRFAPNRMVYHDGNLYLVSLSGLNIVVADHEGNFKKGYDLFSLLELEEKDRGNVEVIGFSVDREGNILFTVPALFRACILSPDGKMNWFGKAGKRSGKIQHGGGNCKRQQGELRGC